MITKGQRKEGIPILADGVSSRRLERIPLEQRSFSESWIQALIQDYPDLLPIDSIESSFSPLIPIGREVSTPAGNIDNLYISPDGYLTIVETKLWRNPEARREVRPDIGLCQRTEPLGYKPARQKCTAVQRVLLQKESGLVGDGQQP